MLGRQASSTKLPPATCEKQQSIMGSMGEPYVTYTMCSFAISASGVVLRKSAG